MFLACMCCLISLYGFSQSKTTTIRIKNNSTWEPVLEYLPTESEGFEENKMNKKIIRKLNEVYELCTSINDIGSPEQIMKEPNFESLCDFADMQPNYSAACLMKANETHNKAILAVTSLEDAMILAAKNRNDNLVKRIRFVKSDMQMVYENSAFALKSSTLKDYNTYISWAVNMAKTIPEKIEKLIESCR